MQLNETEKDTLIELMNIGFGRAAAALSKLTGYRIVLDVPDVRIHPLHHVGDVLHEYLDDEVASVHQVFTGPVGGDAFLILDRTAAGTLKQLLTDEAAVPIAEDPSAVDVLTEVGNILLNACLGTIGNFLKVQVSFSVPRMTLQTLSGLLDSLVVGREGLRYALVVHTGFSLRDSALKGYVVVVLGVASLHRLFRATRGVEQWRDEDS